MRARDLMTKNPACATMESNAQQVAHLMEQNDCGCVPVVDSMENGKLVGVITDRDLALRGVALGKSHTTSVADLMSRDVACVQEDDDVSEVERLMSDRQIRRVVVANADGCCIGIVSQADLARATGDGDLSRNDVAGVVHDISAPGAPRTTERGTNTVPSRASMHSTPRYGSAGAGGAEYEQGPETD
jgi:CBS domain-containing protein